MTHSDGIDRQIIAKRIKYARQCAKITQHNVADSLGVTPQQISNYERGVTPVPHGILSTMADLYECTIDFLLGKNGSVPVGNDLKNIIGEAANNLNEKQAQAAFELHGNFDGFLKLICTKHLDCIAAANECMEAAMLCFSRLSEINGVCSKCTTDVCKKDCKYYMENSAMSKVILNEIENMNGRFAKFALSRLIVPPEENK